MDLYARSESASQTRDFWTAILFHCGKLDLMPEMER